MKAVFIFRKLKIPYSCITNPIHVQHIQSKLILNKFFAFLHIKNKITSPHIRHGINQSLSPISNSSIRPKKSDIPKRIAGIQDIKPKDNQGNIKFQNNF